MRDVPDAVVAKAREVGAHDWLETLPALVAELAARWELRVGAAFADATEAYVAEAVRADGSAAVLKVHVPFRADAAAREITVLRVTGGRACVRLLESDATAGALLVQRLGPAMSELALPQPHRLAILCDLAAAVWQPSDAALPDGAGKAASLADYIRLRWTGLGEPCSRRAYRDALAAAQSRRRAHDPARAVLLHGDVHQWNALRTEGEGFRLVDPDGLIAEPEYDLGVLLREDPAELMTGDPYGRAEWLAARTGTDPQAIWEWGLVERVATGLALTTVGVQPVAAEMLAAADEISRRAASAG